MPENSSDFRLRTVLELYEADLDTPSVINGELSRWFNRWSNVAKKDRPTTALAALDVCSMTDLKNIMIMLRILATLPVTTATAERSFSTLKRLKTYLRSTMGEQRLSGLALMAVHREQAANINVQHVIDDMATRRRRINLALV